MLGELGDRNSGTDGTFSEKGKLPRLSPSVRPNSALAKGISFWQVRTVQTMSLGTVI
jgi:hypothetical protein